MHRREGRQAGNAIIEFSLVGIPMIFVLISTFEMARGMWTYDTMAHALRRAARFAVVHGKNCSASGNTCGITVGDVAHRIADDGTGLDPGVLNVTLTSNSGDVTCNPLNSCFNNTSAWPPSTANNPGMNVSITGTYAFASALAMFWPGTGPGTVFGTVNLPAFTRQPIQF